MSKLVNFTFIVIAAVLFAAYIEARATSSIRVYEDRATNNTNNSNNPNVVNNVSYLDDLKLFYNNQTDLWTCDMVICPSNTAGCRILRYNDVNQTNTLWRVNHCYNSYNYPTFSLYFSREVPAAPKLDININSFNGAVTELIYGYSNTSQTVNGTVRWEDWSNVQQQYREIILQASNQTFV